MQQSRALVPGIMDLIHPLGQDTNWGLFSFHWWPIYPQQDTLAIWLMKSTLLAPLGHTLYLPGPLAPNMKLLPLSTLQVHLTNESQLSNMFSSCVLVHQGHNTSKLLLNFSQIHLWTTLNYPLLHLNYSGTSTHYGLPTLHRWRPT